MTDDERAALQRKIATEIRASIETVRKNPAAPDIARAWIGGWGFVPPGCTWLEVVALVVLDDRLRDALAQVMQTHVMLEELARASALEKMD